MKEPEKKKGWKEMTREERDALSPLERAEAKLRDIEARRSEARRKVAKERSEEAETKRQRDTRRKRILGSWLVAWLDETKGSEAGVHNRRLVSEQLDGFLSKEDRELFPDLLPPPDSSGRDAAPPSPTGPGDPRPPATGGVPVSGSIPAARLLPDATNPQARLSLDSH